MQKMHDPEDDSLRKPVYPKADQDSWLWKSPFPGNRQALDRKLPKSETRTLTMSHSGRPILIRDKNFLDVRLPPSPAPLLHIRRAEQLGYGPILQ